ncbi:hypothetical protein OUZ56_025988 [Daphnia magna]|uniref:Uncharacterized protein n=1 Tax=Daphnia magna TaxID=35525 RepID=A0ABQ9ZKZ5_9CRUS|nr:hypothetical protein OUZ56_025988 [Daphnia magna]
MSVRGLAVRRRREVCDRINFFWVRPNSIPTNDVAQSLYFAGPKRTLHQLNFQPGLPQGGQHLSHSHQVFLRISRVDDDVVQWYLPVPTLQIQRPEDASLPHPRQRLFDPRQRVNIFYGYGVEAAIVHTKTPTSILFLH